eukprot:GHVU01011948.1.p1 GENE.GHVU01011948.1~~GHVU01011948.1.p1  ORF type:complete len:169 (-),score=22.48 GHVU01011948.1:323-829(-)
MDTLKLPTAALQQTEPRASAETDRRHLLSDSSAPSPSTSRATSIIDYAGDGDRTPRASSPAFSTSTTTTQRARIPAGHTRHASLADPAPPQPYRGFPSEEHYMAALREWAESKKYLQQDQTQLIGFYGDKTLQEYADKPKMEGLGLRRKWKARKEEKTQKIRRGSAAV